jgi:hypothetical protein
MPCAMLSRVTRPARKCFFHIIFINSTSFEGKLLNVNMCLNYSVQLLSQTSLLLSHSKDGYEKEPQCYEYT